MPVFFLQTRMTLSNLKNLSNVCVTVSCTFRFISQQVHVQLTLTDRSVSVQRESSSALGQGCRLGFLGTLHMDVFRQRLEDEHDANIIVTAPTVPYKGALSLPPRLQQLMMRLNSRLQRQDRHCQQSYRVSGSLGLFLVCQRGSRTSGQGNDHRSRRFVVLILGFPSLLDFSQITLAR